MEMTNGYDDKDELKKIISELNKQKEVNEKKVAELERKIRLLENKCAEKYKVVGAFYFETIILFVLFILNKHFNDHDFDILDEKIKELEKMINSSNIVQEDKTRNISLDDDTYRYEDDEYVCTYKPSK